MLLNALREQVLEANLELNRRGLVLYTFGNVSGISREDGLVVIKPSGVPYERMTPSDMVVTDLDGSIVEGTLRASSDLPTHLELYKAFPDIGGVAHTHSEFATVWAQARRPIPCFGTTHADYFFGSIPVTDDLSPDEIVEDYEKNTGLVIRRCFHGQDPGDVPAVLVAGHGPFSWGESAMGATRNAVILEFVARIAFHTVDLRADADPIPSELLNKHFRRKHGPDAYYGQPAGGDSSGQVSGR
jgi:L-ribulose-5-phosphate 4-epimerase